MSGVSTARFGLDRLSIISLAIAILIAGVSAMPYAGSWNDGSRLAAIESLVDYHTWAIDDSMFVRGTARPDVAKPYPPGDLALQKSGTQDKMWIRGHFYSDKSPVPNLCLAIVYRGIQLASGLIARDHAHRFCYLITLVSSGLAYVISVYCIDRLGAVCGLRPSTRGLVTLSFALGTIALPYARYLNSHILLLAVCSLVMLLISNEQRFSITNLISIGLLIGIGYTLDVAIGSVLVAGVVALIAARERRWKPVFIALGAAFPWFALHHALNYTIAGTFLPANANPEFFRWPGSPFDADTLTGGWHHASVGKFIGYALDLLAGHRGFFWHNLPVLLVVPGAIWLLWRHIPEMSHVSFAVAISAFSWLIYSVASNNHAGQCCSVRWFVPLLAPGYYVLVLLLRYDVPVRTELGIITAGSVILGLLMWRQGPWNGYLVPGFWLIVGATCFAWLFYRIARLRRAAEIINHKGYRSSDGPVRTK
jgi:hypothetical protein